MRLRLKLNVSIRPGGNTTAMLGHLAMGAELLDLSRESLLAASKTLESGGVVAIPTETVYGLAGRIANETALRRIFEVKDRPFFDPLIVHVSNINQAKGLVKDWPPWAQQLADKFWPGPLTLILPKSSKVNPLITSGLETVALRMPRHKGTLELITRVGPLAAPSANRFGRTSPTRAEHVLCEFPQAEGLLILDGGPCEVGLESTVVGFDAGAGKLQIFRPGHITKEALEIEGFEVEFARSPASPGGLKAHYQPNVPLVICKSPFNTETLVEINTRLGKTLEKPVILDLSDDPRLAARELYAKMRNLSQEGDLLLFQMAEKFTQDPSWAAIWDRIQRASSAVI